MFGGLLTLMFVIIGAAIVKEQPLIGLFIMVIGPFIGLAWEYAFDKLDLF